MGISEHEHNIGYCCMEDPSETKWKVVEKVSAALKSNATRPEIYKRLAVGSYAPLLNISDHNMPNLREHFSTTACKSRPITLCLFAVYMPEEVYGGAHLCGLVCDVSKNNTFQFFDPHGSAGLFNRKISDFLKHVFARLQPAITECQKEGWLASTGKPFSYSACNIAAIQNVQHRLFASKGVTYFGLCALMSTMMLYNYQQHEGRLSLKAISEYIVKDPVFHIADFCRMVWNEAYVPEDPDMGLHGSRMNGLVHTDRQMSRNGAAATAVAVKNVVNTANSLHERIAGVKRSKQASRNAAGTENATVRTDTYPGFDRHQQDDEDDLDVKRRRLLPSMHANANSTQMRSILDVSEELDWFFFNVHVYFALVVAFTNYPTARLQVCRIGRDRMRMHVTGVQAPGLSKPYETNVEQLVTMLEFPLLVASPLAVFGRAATVTYTNAARQDVVLWNRAEGFNRANMSITGAFPLS